eukprot:CAMPEP_0194511912 /NCGR_PEP_ID=MMETSP0253-20130528/43722_1 /TAXON_ID=2966 /ORGANISM="Noctiluca scintillans" /LENGTH=116 /DNA_ID=CAMNT_0039355297 /DNA_START=56 /DNA_END=404 /DNA_ORIENTATION=-
MTHKIALYVWVTDNSTRFTLLVLSALHRRTVAAQCAESTCTPLATSSMGAQCFQPALQQSLKDTRAWGGTASCGQSGYGTRLRSSRVVALSTTVAKHHPETISLKEAHDATCGACF